MMKKLLSIMLMASMVLSFNACGGDDDGVSNSQNNASNANMGVNNTTDPVVTGGVQEVGMSYADVLAYYNSIPGAPDAYLWFGVDYGENKDNLDKSCSGMRSGRTITIKLTDLKPNTTYYYRAYMDVGNEYYKERNNNGTEIGTFTTKPFEVDVNGLTVTASDIRFEDAKLKITGTGGNQLSRESIYIGIGVSKSKSNLENNFVSLRKRWPGYWESSKNDANGIVYYREDNNLGLDGLDPGTTYYFLPYIELSGNVAMGQTQSFTTADVLPHTGFIDLGLSVKWAACNIGQTIPWADYSKSEDLDGTPMTWEDAQAAVINQYGSGARLPTKAEFSELFSCLTGDNDLEFNAGAAVITGKNGKQLVLCVGHTYWTSEAQYNTDKAHYTASIFTTYPWKGWGCSISSYCSSNSNKYLVRAVLGDGTGSGNDNTISSNTGSGTESDPFNVATALKICKDAKAAGKSSAGYYYVKGIVTKEFVVDENHTNAVDIDLYDVEGATEKLPAIMCAGPSHKPLIVGYRIPKGATVIVYGDLDVRRQTYRIYSGNIVSVNGQVPEYDKDWEPTLSIGAHGNTGAGHRRDARR